MWTEFRSKNGIISDFLNRRCKKTIPFHEPDKPVSLEKKGYIIKLRNHWYAFNVTENHENIDWLAANLIY
jgi:hypothetical protein